MRESPILFSAPMVRAIIDGRKTATRRVVKPEGADHIVPFIGADNQRTGEYGWCPHPCLITKHIRCPYGQPGDRLWVRESLGYDAEWGHYFKAAGKHGQVTYLCELFDDPEAETGPSYDESLPDRGVPSIHLPRRYSRITLEVTGVRVERLQDITEEQAHREGVDNHMCAQAVGKSPYKGGPATIMGFAHLWEQINGSGSWDANPWVWVVEFRRIEHEARAA